MDGPRRHRFRQTLASPPPGSFPGKDTARPRRGAYLQKNKKAARVRGLGNKKTSAVSLLRGRRRGLGAGWSRPRSRRPCAAAGAGGCRPGLLVVSVDDRLGDVERSPVKHRTVRPRGGNVDHHSQIVVLDVLHDHGLHFLEEARFDLLLLALEIFLRVLGIALELLLFLI